VHHLFVGLMPERKPPSARRNNPDFSNTLDLLPFGVKSVDEKEGILKFKSAEYDG
jgi:hypothetical protein